MLVIDKSSIINELYPEREYGKETGYAGIISVTANKYPNKELILHSVFMAVSAMIITGLSWRRKRNNLATRKQVQLIASYTALTGVITQISSVFS